MGLFDGIKGGLKDLALDKLVDKIEDSVESVAENVADSIGLRDSNASYAPAQQNTEYSAPQNTESAAPQNDGMSVVQRFEQIFATEFADLQVSKEVSAESVGIAAPSPCRPYSYALKRGGQPVLVIMLTPHNRDHNAAYMNAKAAAEKSSVAFLNFYTHFQNDRSYIVSRIRNAL